MGYLNVLAMTRLLLICLVALSCSKKQEEVKYGDAIGIELAGEGLMGAVAPERGHDLPASAVPEIATALLNAAKACPDLKGKLDSGKYVSVHANVADGTLHAEVDDKDAVNACIAKALEGKPVKQLPATKLLVQIAAKGQ